MNQHIEQIAIADIHILNPRVRNAKVFAQMKDNIAKVGLKRPITVTRSISGDLPYDLVCGQGRIEALTALGQTHIPALVIDKSEEDALVMSLVENIARRQHRSLDLLHGVEALKQKGYKVSVIAQKTGLGESYVYSVLDLLKRGEQRLITAVEAGQIPLSVAVAIASSAGDEQAALQEAYETKQLRGKKLIAAKALLERRQRLGKGMTPSIGGNKQRGVNSGAVTSKDVMEVYQREVDRKRLLTRKANMVSDRLLFITQALRRIYAEEHFTTLLKAEGLDTLPKALAEIMGETP